MIVIKPIKSSLILLLVNPKLVFVDLEGPKTNKSRYSVSSLKPVNTPKKVRRYGSKFRSSDHQSTPSHKVNFPIFNQSGTRSRIFSGSGFNLEDSSNPRQKLNRTNSEVKVIPKRSSSILDSYKPK